MKENKIDIKAESFPWQVKLLGALSLIASLAFVPNSWLISIPLLLIGLVLVTGYSGTEIDPAGKTFREYNSYLFVKTGMVERYGRLEHIFVNAQKMSQTMRTAHTNSGSTFRYYVYNAYLKLDDRKIFLTSRRDKDKLMKILHPVVSSLSVKLTDNTILS